jgi:hypothetical protein
MLIVKTLDIIRGKNTVLWKNDHLSWLAYTRENVDYLFRKFKMDSHYYRNYLKMINQDLDHCGFVIPRDQHIVE